MVIVGDSSLAMLTHGDVLLIRITRRRRLVLYDGFSVGFGVKASDLGIIIKETSTSYISLIFIDLVVTVVSIHNHSLLFTKAILILSSSFKDFLGTSHEHVLLTNIVLDSNLIFRLGS